MNIKEQLSKFTDILKNAFAREGLMIELNKSIAMITNEIQNVDSDNKFIKVVQDVLAKLGENQEVIK